MPITPPQPPSNPPGGNRLFMRRTGVERHLVIVHKPGWQSIEDWYAIAEKVIRIDGRIGVFVVSDQENHERSATLAGERPSLIFSPALFTKFAPLRGKIYRGGVIPKLEQLRRLASAGVRVPLTTELRADTVLDPKVWGDFVVVKPTHIASSSHGSGIQLIATGRVRYIPREDYPADHPGRHAPMIVQQFVDTGKTIKAYRILTLFGHALYCQLSEGSDRRVSLDADHETIERANIAIQQVEARKRHFVYNADAVFLAEAAYRAIPEVPLQGCDVLIDANTGKSVVLELNPGGNTWHFSSAFNAHVRAAETQEQTGSRLSQLDAFSTAAHVLAERTTREAL